MQLWPTVSRRDATWSLLSPTDQPASSVTVIGIYGETARKGSDEERREEYGLVLTRPARSNLPKTTLSNNLPALSLLSIHTVYLRFR
jgi:hypothetical protein